jgi:thiol-disulfide isomerase/thioredoxin
MILSLDNRYAWLAIPLSYQGYGVMSVSFDAWPRLILVLFCAATMGLSSFGQDAVKSSTAKPATDKTPAQAAKPTPELPPLPNLTFAANSSAQELDRVIATAKGIRPGSADQYSAMQIAIRDASKQLMTVLKDKNLPRYKQAQLDSMSSSLALATFFGEEARAKVVAQLKQMLRERETLSIEDVQMATIAAANLELNPNKKDARDIYALLDEMLAEDKREEMQSMRINLQSSLRRIDLLGSKFEIEHKDIRNKPIKTEDFAGKFVIVDFFASWCQPCLSEVPRLKKYAAKYKEKGLEVLAISLDETRDELDRYLSDADLPWPVIHDNAEDPLEKLQLKFGVAALPTVLLLNKEGTVVSLEARGAELDRLMEMLFEAPTPAEAPPGDKAADKKADAPTPGKAAAK